MAIPPPSCERIVAVGLLTQRDVELLGVGFRRLFPLDGDAPFDDLLRQLDRIEAQSCRSPDAH
ncbi:hypothetical protein [uncultured Sphingomonas sp.]|uniref:hypothetical protein n=1 Tax=uncultured Sphingomonas sp. TaxID=158754 RepID=UPI0035CC514E